MPGKLLGNFRMDAAPRQGRNERMPQGVEVRHAPVGVAVFDTRVEQVGTQHFRRLVGHGENRVLRVRRVAFIAPAGQQLRCRRRQP